MNRSDPQVAVIILNYNTPELTHTLIESIEKQASDFACQIIVIDNNSRDGFKYRPRTGAPRQRVIHLNHNLGFARAANFASTLTDAPYLLFANSDCRLTANIVSVMHQYLESNRACAACAPRLLFPDGSPHSSIRRFPDYRNISRSRGSLLPAREGYTIAADTVRKPVEAVSATFLMVRHDLFDRAGRFEPSYFMYVEDTDLCRKFADAGKQIVYLGDLEVTHHWGESCRRQPLRLKLEHHRSIRNYFYRHVPNRRLANLSLSLQLAVNLVLVGFRMVVLRRK
ncbi:MAG: glycosyltransferase family 2 protein [candidate division Zixibacteria bacterium]|nr:glycosyltransferase family 2 protein [candidate division Zixibacteria bacterium]